MNLRLFVCVLTFQQSRLCTFHPFGKDTWKRGRKAQLLNFFEKDLHPIVFAIGLTKSNLKEVTVNFYSNKQAFGSLYVHEFKKMNQTKN